MRKYNFIIRIAVLALLVSCNRFEPINRVFDNCAYLDVSATSQTQSAPLATGSAVWKNSFASCSLTLQIRM